MRLTAVTVLAAALLAAPLAAQQQSILPEFLAGRWIERAGDRITEESWTPGPTRMLGTARQTTAGEETMRELLVIERTGDTLVLIVQAPDERPVTFRAVSQSQDEVEFANPAHDYPQRIRYWRDGEQLRAEISLLDGGERLSWNYQPVP